MIRTTYTIGCLLGLTLCALVGCDDSGDSTSGDTVLILADRDGGNAPARIALEALVLDGNGAALPTTTGLSYAWDFGDGSTSDDPTPSHVFEAAGDYTVTATVSGPDGELGSGTFEVGISPPAGLSVADVQFTPTQGGAEEQITATFTIQNDGAAPIGPWAIEIFAARSEIRDASARRLKRIEVDGDIDSPGFTETFPIPSDLSSGSYRVGVVADADEAIGDTDREDNVAWGLPDLQVRNAVDTGPDLVICAVEVPAFAAGSTGEDPVLQQGDQIEGRLCMSNGGNRPAARTSYRILLTPDPESIPADAPVVASGDGPALEQGGQDFVDTIIDIPADLAPGTWHLIAEADPEDEVAEQREDNNTRALAQRISVVEIGEVPGVDLVLESLTVDGEVAFWGQTLPGQLVIANRGDTSVERSFVVRIEADPQSGRESVQLVSVNVGGLAAGARETLDVDVRITQRVEPGEYRLSAEADAGGSTDDVNRANNRRTLQTIVRLGGEPDVDPAVSGVDIDPEEVEAGSPITVSATISNTGMDPTGALEVAVLLSPDPEFADGGITVATYQLDSLMGGAQTAFSESVTIPQDLDQRIPSFWVAVAVDPDNRLAEPDEANNFERAARPLVVTGATGGCAEDAANEPNDVPQDAVALDPGDYAGLGVCDEADWFAVGVAAGAGLEVTIRWADDSDPASLALTDEMGAVIADAEGEGTSRVVFEPPAAEARTRLLRVTGGGAELQYDLSIQSAAPGDDPNLRVRRVRPNPGVVQPGAPISVRFDASNTGGAAAPATDAEVRLVRAGDDGNGDVLGTVEVPALEGGEEIPVVAELGIPEGTANGLYLLRVVADAAAAVAEGDEDDNIGSASIRVSSEDACEVDALEPNGSPFEEGVPQSAAANIQAGQVAGLATCRGDDDWYAVALSEGERLDVTIEFDPAGGDLDLALYDTDGETRLDESAGLQNRETVTLRRAPADGTYFVRAYLAPGDEVSLGNTYSIDVNVQPADACGDDGFEPNASRDEAQLLPDGLHELTLCPGDEDWFRFNIPAGNLVSYQVNSGAAGVTISLFGPDGALIDESNRRITLEAEENGEYALRASVDADEAVVYTLNVAGVSGVDLAVEELTVSPAAGAPGTDVRAITQVANLRGDPANGVLLRYVLSNDARLSAEDEVLVERLVDLPAAGALEVRQKLTIPADAESGARFVVAVIDPERRIPDLRPGNNELAAPLAIDAGCADDDDRENEGPRTATPLMAADGAYEGGVICPFSEDWFSLEVPAGEVTIGIGFTHASGDLDLTVYDADGANILGESRSESDDESVTFDAAAGTVLIRVDGFFEATNSYTLSWTLP